jgi:uncharacterized membrane protein HdeD (DUF308 family)
MPKQYMQWRWWTIALRGVAAILFGVFTLLAPQVTFLSLVMLFGIFALVDGVLALSIGSRTVQTRGAIIARGLVSLIAGVVALAWPGMTALAMLVTIGVWAIVSGGLEIAAAIRMRKLIEHEWLLGVEGAISIVFGAALLMSPLAGVIVIGIWIGAFALVLGGMLVASSFRVRSLVREHPELERAVPA